MFVIWETTGTKTPAAKRSSTHFKSVLTFVALVSFVVPFLAACGTGGADPKPGVMQGQRAVDFALKTPGGEDVLLADYQGQVVLINFWASWCGPCELEMPDIQKAYDAHREQGLQVLAVNAGESPSTVREFGVRHGLTFPLLLDAGGQVNAKYRAAGLPMSLVVDREGVIHVRHLGYMSAGQLARYLAQVGLE